jgi:hypothetical protein
MDRAQMIDALRQLGFPADKINDSVPDEVLQTWLKLLGGNDTAQPQSNSPPGPDGQFMDRDQDGVTPPNLGKHADSQAPLNAPGVAADPATVPSPDPAAPAVAHVDPASNAPVPGNNPSDQEPKKMSAQKFAEQMAQMTPQKFAELVQTQVQAALNGPLQTLLQKQKAIDAQLTKRLADERSQRIHKFGEEMIRAGNLTRGEWDGNPDQKVPGLKHTMLAMDEARTVKFADMQVSAVDLLMEQVRHRRKVMRFAEILPDVPGPAIAETRREQLLNCTQTGRIAAQRRKSAAAK